MTTGFTKHQKMAKWMMLAPLFKKEYAYEELVLILEVKFPTEEKLIEAYKKILAENAHLFTEKGYQPPTDPAGILN